MVMPPDEQSTRLRSCGVPRYRRLHMSPTFSSRGPVPTLAAVLALLVLAAPAFGQGAEPPTNPSSPQDWRQAYEQTLREEYGWLSVAGLTLLPDGEHTLGSAPEATVPLPAGRAPAQVGTLVVAGRSATLRLAPGVQARLNGQAIEGEVVLTPAERATPGQAAPVPDKVRIGAIEIHLHESGSRLALRVRDPDSPIRTGFQGPRWFPLVDTARVTATLAPFEEPRTVDVRNILGDDEPYRSPGHVEFRWEGRKTRLMAFTGTRGRLLLIFRDATVGRETYGTRYAFAEPTGDGRYVIDFNKAYNPPCAYNPYTSCPTTPPQNVLKVAIRAGEQLYDGPAPPLSR